MTLTLIAIAAALALCALALLVLLARRTRRAVRAEADAERNGLLAEIASLLDLDEVLARTLDAAISLTGADAGLLSAGGDGAAPIVAAVGLSAEEAEQQAAALPADERNPRPVSVAYRYGEAGGAAGAVHAALAAPLVSDEASLAGHLTVFTRAPERSFDEQATLALVRVAAHAAPAIENARRFREARQLADLDALTALHNRRYFHETLAREVARAHRYGRRLALVVFDLDDFKAVNDRIGHLAGDAVLAELADRVREVVRATDVPCRIGGDEFAVVLPESTLDDAEQLFERIREAVGTGRIAGAEPLRLSAGITELQPEDDAIAFFQRADEALYRAKAGGKDRSMTASGEN